MKTIWGYAIVACALLLALSLPIESRAMGDKGGGKSDVTDAWVGSGFQKKQPIGMPWHSTEAGGLARYEGMHFGVLLGGGSSWLRFGTPTSSFSMRSRLHFRVGPFLTIGGRISQTLLFESDIALTLARIGGLSPTRKLFLYRVAVPAHLNLVAGSEPAAQVAGVGVEAGGGLTGRPWGIYGRDMNRFDLALSLKVGFRCRRMQATIFYSHGLLNQSRLEGGVLDYSAKGISIHADLKTMRIYNASLGVAVALIF